ncbi:MAG: rhodanese-like domain-containing protein [Gammaproteobacteria bacterium]
MKHLPETLLLMVVMTFSTSAWSYDKALAESYAKLFAPVQDADAGKALHLMPPDVFVEKVKSKEPLAVIDIRTPAEAAVYSMTLPDSLIIPVNELFAEASLDRIPTDKTVVIVCASGTRAAAAGTALRHIGFENVYVLKGGFKSLTAYMGAKEANSPPAASPVKQ